MVTVILLVLFVLLPLPLLLRKMSDEQSYREEANPKFKEWIRMHGYDSTVIQLSTFSTLCHISLENSLKRLFVQTA
jgi:hypothetical protein